MELPDLDIPDLSDQRLADYLCKTRTVFPLMLNNDDFTQVECLMPLRTTSPYQSPLEYIIVRSLTDEDAPLTVMQMALVRDCLKGADRQRLDEACGRPNWTVTKAEYYAGHCIRKPDGCSSPTWKLQVGSSAQTERTGLVQYITQRRCERRPRLVNILQPWHTDPLLPSRIVNLSLTFRTTTPRSCQLQGAGKSYSVMEESGLLNKTIMWLRWTLRNTTCY